VLLGEFMTFTVRAVVAAVAAGLLTSACGGGASGPSPSAAPAASAPASSTAVASPSPSSPPAAFGYQPLYPFASLAEAETWQASYTSGGHQPWHLSANRTALSFTQGYLGFSGINRVVRHTLTSRDARVAVGFALPNGRLSRAAVIHLVRYGAGRYAPWEVVGTDDTSLTLDVPAYGSAVSSPVRIGGMITGVDENLRAEVHALGAGSPVGTYCCKPAGGQASPWSFRVTFNAAAGQVITIVVHVGGHVAGVERFAVTGVRAR
jgi:hypothetical protein